MAQARPISVLRARLVATERAAGLALCLIIGATILALPTRARAATPADTILLVSETMDDASNRYWWHCGERQEQLFSDQLAPQLKRLGLALADDCQALATPPHKSYRKARLMRHEVINLGNALGARRVVFGEARFARGKDHPRLGLVHVTLTVVLRAHDLQMERGLGPIERRADGFATTLEAARAKAVHLVVSQLLDELPELTRTPRPKPQPALVLQLPLDDAPTGLDRRLDALSGLTGVARVELRELTRRAAIVHVRPVAARAEIEAWLQQANLPYSVVEPSAGPDATPSPIQ